MEPVPTMAPDPVDDCSTDLDCPDEQYCDQETDSCQDGCRPGECDEGFACDFESRECVEEVACEGDDDCADEEFCSDEDGCQVGCREGGCPDGEACDLDTRQCVEIETPCGSDDECDDGNICEDGQCVDGCREDAACAGGEICSDDRCVDGCREDGACDANEYCTEDSVCEDGCRVGGCNDGEVCDLDTRQCLEIPCEGDGDCDSGQVCEDGQCIDGCRDDEGCFDNQFCDGGQCAEGCREGSCPQGQFCDLDSRACTDVPCANDGECGESEICEDGACVEGCREDGACPDDQFCGENTCQDGCREGGCPEGEVCNLDSRECELDLEDGPAIVVEPSEIDFGEVLQDASAFQNLTIRNIGTEDLVVNEVRLQQNPSTGFQVIVPTPGAITVASQGSVTVRLRFEPTFLRNGEETRYNNTVIVESNDPDGNVEVGITGLGVPSDDAACVRFTQRDVNFGFVEPGDVSARNFALENCGGEDLEITGMSIDGSDDFSFVVGGGFPRTLDAGDELSIVLNYLPSGFEAVQASLIAETDGDISAESIIRADGAGCPTAVSLGRVVADEEGEFVQGALTAFLGDTIELSGEESFDPADGDLEFVWAISSPEDSMSINVDPDLESEGLSFTPDAAGTYEVTLSVRSARSGIDACESSVFTVVIFEPPLVTVEVTWDDFSDLDLHLIRTDSEGEFSELGTGQNVNENDCYFGNLTPDWGEEGETSDNPRYLVDDLDGFGPETVLMSSLEEDRRYQIAVRLSQDRGRGETEVTIRVTVGDVVEEFTGELDDQGDIIRPAIINGDGTIDSE
jgi:hypothetical protein